MPATASIHVSGTDSVELEFEDTDGNPVRQVVNPGQLWNVTLDDGDVAGVHITRVPSAEGAIVNDANQGEGKGDAGGESKSA